MAQVLELRFRNEESRMSTIAIPEPDQSVEAEQLETAMSAIIAEDVFTTAGGDLDTIVDARIVTRTVDTLFEVE